MEDGSFNIELINTRNLNLNKNHNILEFVSKSFKMKKKALDDMLLVFIIIPLKHRNQNTKNNKKTIAF